MQTTYVLRSDLNPTNFYKGLDRNGQPLETDSIGSAMHFPDVDTANINRDSIAEQTGYNFSVEEVTM